MYRIKSTGEIKSQGELRKMFYNTSFPRVWDESVLDHIGVDPVFESPTPATTRYQTAFKSGVKQLNGKWVWAWTIGPTFTSNEEATAAEQQAAHVKRIDDEQAARVRADRDKRLADTDWTQVADAPVDSEAWATYRQALRNIPAQATFPWDVVWPEMPE